MSQMLVLVCVATAITSSSPGAVRAQLSAAQVEPEELEEPQMPEGLDDEPALPEGADTVTAKVADEPETLGGAHGRVGAFFDLRWGARVRDDPQQRWASLGELRAHGEAELDWTRFGVRVAADLLFDPVLGAYEVHLERGDGFVDVREYRVFLAPLEILELRIGRQILTWGTGDLVFINDLFPKGWTAFLIGRDLDYLKAPSDAAKVSLFTPALNIDLVYVPVFDSDRIPDRRRISTWDPPSMSLAGRDALLTVTVPKRWFRDFELAGRAYRRLGSYEIAAYGYWGFWKSPAGFDSSNGTATHPPLSVWGASLRGPLLGGLIWLEGAWFDSRSDRKGEDPLVEDPQLRSLVGYEHLLVPNLTLGVQAYAEIRISPVERDFRDEVRIVTTARFTWTSQSQNLMLSLFAYVSPTDVDAHLRLQMMYRVDDHWGVGVGSNLFFGRDPDTFFGQFERASSFWTSVRLSV